jgi:hypothetical protein
MPSDGILARLPKKKEKITMVMKGWNKAQPTPMAVCLYLTFKSRHDKK